jgi:hypothetical protein
MNNYTFTIVRVKMEEIASCRAYSIVTVFRIAGLFKRKLSGLCIALCSLLEHHRFPFVIRLAIMELRITHYKVHPFFLTDLIVLVGVKFLKQRPRIRPFTSS